MRQATFYIGAGYKSEPPPNGHFKYLAPYLHQIWILACSEAGNPDERTLEEFMKAIEKDAKLRQPKHTRRMVLLSTKRGEDRHSDFLEKIVEHYSVIEFDTMTGDELVIHLFIRDADQQMSKKAQELLRSEPGSKKQNQPYGITEKNMAR